ncbi:hypothetical protein [Spirillospora sp. NPDC029432]|uniref:hypothetical protein n=1 Tax=Spirillospora sp. NPDC029432 TaxID=3154599 RepID=UPI003457389E
MLVLSRADAGRAEKAKKAEEAKETEVTDRPDHHASQEPGGYEIRIRGRVSAAFQSAFEDLAVTVNPAETVLRGRGLDQSGLYGVLARVHELGLELIEIRRLP